MDFDFKPVLEGPLLTMRPLLRSDFNNLYAVANDPLMWEQHPDKERYKKDVFSRFFEAAIESDHALLAIDKISGFYAGSSRFHDYDPEKRQIEIGWSFLGRPYWGGIYNREMKQLMLNHAFQFVDVVNLVIDENNQRSQHAAKKIGGQLVQEGLHRNGLVNVVYAITEHSFQTSNHSTTGAD